MYKNLWLTAADWMRWQESWMNDSLVNIDPELMATNVQNAFKTMHKAVKYFKYKSFTSSNAVYVVISYN